LLLPAPCCTTSLSPAIDPLPANLHAPAAAAVARRSKSRRESLILMLCQ
jgi:hypothetical protein